MPANKATYSSLMKKLRANEFVITGELQPGRIGNLDPILEEAKAVKDYVTAVNVPDNTGSLVSMNGLATCTYLNSKIDLELIYHQTGRDVNRLGIASMLLAANAVGIKNILVLTGDHPTLGDIPRTKPVFDLDSTQILQLAREMVDHQTIYGNPIDDSDKHPIQLHIGIAANPNTTHPEIELLKIQRKVELGAEFIQTQPIMDLEKCEGFLKELQKKKLPTVIGLIPIKNYTIGRELEQNTTGIKIPTRWFEELKKIKQSNKDNSAKQEAYNKLNIENLTLLIEELRKKTYASGIHIAAAHYPEIYPLLFS
jgi:5,10-methylenetetrahydrofolate reductase